MLPAPSPDRPAPGWLARAVRRLSEDPSPSAAVAVALEGDDAFYPGPRAARLLLAPIDAATGMPRFFVALLVPASSGGEGEVCRRLDAAIQLIALTPASMTEDGEAIAESPVVGVLRALGAQAKFRGASLTLCNEIAARFGADRVSLGVEQGRCVRVRAMNATEKIVRQTRLVQDLELAMEECLDQDEDLRVPPEVESTVIDRATRELASRHGAVEVRSLPVRARGAACGVLTLERFEGGAALPDEGATLRLLLDLAAPRLIEAYERDRAFGLRAPAFARSAAEWALGARQTWLKLLAILVLAGVLALIFVQGTYKVQGTFALEASQTRVVPAPFDGFLRAALVDVGDAVVAGETVLARLDDAEIRLRLEAARADAAIQEKKAAIAREQGKTAEVQIAEAQGESARADAALFEDRLARASIVAPVSGRVVKGELRPRVGSPVRTGEALLELAPDGPIRAQIAVPEEQINDVRVGQVGRLAVAAFPGDRLAFRVERIEPLAEVMEGRNVFKARVELVEQRPWMRAGMSGVAKIEVDRRSIGWIWTRRMVNWVRMKLWI